jgi:hypothetical protein
MKMGMATNVNESALLEKLRKAGLGLNHQETIMTGLRQFHDHHEVPVSEERLRQFEGRLGELGGRNPSPELIKRLAVAAYGNNRRITPENRSRESILSAFQQRNKPAPSTSASDLIAEYERRKRMKKVA